MILDGLLLFDSAHLITVSATTEASTNVIDLLNNRDMGIGYPLPILVQVISAFQTANAATLNAALQGSTNNATWTTMIQGPAAVAAAALGVGARILEVNVPRPAPGQAIPRYLRILYTVGTGIFTAGMVTAGIVLDRQDYVAYPPGTVVNN